MKHLLKQTYAAWLLYFIIFNIYSIFWRQYVMAEQYDALDSLLWWLKEWGMWLGYTPLILMGLNALSKRLSSINTLIVVGVSTLIFTLATRELINYFSHLESWGIDSVIVNFVAYLPKYGVTYTLVAVVWYLRFHQQEKTLTMTHTTEVTTEEAATTDVVYGNTNEIADSSKICSNSDLQATDLQLKASTNITEPFAAPLEQNGISVERSGTVVIIPFDDIYTIISSGNYVDIYCQSEQYLKRVTLKELLLTLPVEIFMQVHRSHIINLTKVLKLQNSDTGNSQVLLINQQRINVSKKFKSDLKLRINL